jgi:hypothetical protein
MKIKIKFNLLAGLVLATQLTGCVGYNTAFMATKTNVGMDLDTKTPTAEISLARREVVVAPTFENGQTPPVEASFRVKGGWIFASVATTFTGGDAAATVSDLFDLANKGDRTNVIDTTIHLSTAPVRDHRNRPVHLHEPGTVRPLIFGTDTSLGIKVAWSGLTAQYPDSAKFGYNRKEMAFAPVFGTAHPEATELTNKYLVKMPSFLATTDTKAETSGADKSKFRYQQYFATGKAADLLALQPGVRSAIADRLDHTAAKATKDRAVAKDIIKEITPKVDSLNADKAKKYIKWLNENDQLGTGPATKLTKQADTDLPAVKIALKENLKYIGDSKTANAVKEFLATL